MTKSVKREVACIAIVPGTMLLFVFILLSMQMLCTILLLYTTAQSITVETDKKKNESTIAVCKLDDSTYHREISLKNIIQIGN